ncbi:hypothetical protein ACTXNW_14400 [Enterococcus malodoratus]|uniref:hypothetical protein n=1 Tax=Enterococcus malodoratus TaxID=71451 RepID=UPI003FD2C545
MRSVDSRAEIIYSSMSKPRSGASLIQCLGVSPPLRATEQEKQRVGTLGVEGFILKRLNK